MRFLPAALALLVFVLSAADPACPACAPTMGVAPDAADRGAAGLSRMLKALKTRASILMVTAHPDDEDGGMLAYETRGQGARGILMSLNRGEGGQNAMSPELYDELGLVRTHELLAAGQYYGVDQYWSSVIDYGFSKTREEALEKWNHDRVLGDVVRVIRMTHPLVITSVFAGAPTDGHGQHQVAGQMAQEAYLAAGDPAKFPEQIRDEGLQPWTPLKVYARSPFFEPTPQGIYDYATDQYVPVRFFDYVHQKWIEGKPSVNLQIPEGQLAPAAGLTFLQIAREGWGHQKTQNGGATIPPPAPFDSAYHRYDSRVNTAAHEESFFDGMDVSLVGIAALASGDTAGLKDGLTRLAALADRAESEYLPTRPQAIAPALADGLKLTRELLAKAPARSNVAFELCAKERQFEKALTASLGLTLEAATAPERPPSGPFAAFGGPAQTFAIAIPGQSFNVQTTVTNGGPDAVRVESLELRPQDGKAWKAATQDPTVADAAGRANVRARWRVTVPADAALTRPYFSRPNDEQPYYNLDDPRYRNQSFAPYPLTAVARVAYRGVAMDLEHVVDTYQRAPGIGLQAQPLIVGPPISVTIAPSAGAVPLDGKSIDFRCTVHTNVKGPATGVIRLTLPQGWRSDPAEGKFAMARDGEDQVLAFTVSPGQVTPGEHQITAVAEYGGQKYTEGYHLTGYPGVLPYPYYRPAVYRAVGVDVKTAPGLRLGFLPGTGDDVPEALKDLGESARVLSSGDLKQGDLSGYDAIILGVRAYAVRPELKQANARLLEYVHGGGVLIVQYNLQDFDQEYGPYTFSLGQNPQKVVDENSSVQLLEPDSPLFTWPNRVTAKDFEGWVEERGHGFMRTWDPKYQALIETHDPGQDPQKGGLLVARYGRGTYIYDAFALYRQLPEGVPGAYRILANLVSLAKNPKWSLPPASRSE